MAAHRVGPLAERHFSGFARSMQIEPIDDRFGLAARHSAPDAAFTAAILTALAVGAPAASSAATLTAVSTTAAPSLLVKALALLGGAALGAAGGTAGVLFGTRQLKRLVRLLC